MIDLHLHLDGAISLASTRSLAMMQDIEVPESDAQLLRKIRVSPDCHDLNEFLEKFDFPCSLLMTPEGMENAVRNLLQELYLQGILYAEIRYAPQLCCTQMTQEENILAAMRGLEKSPIQASLILCCMRGTDCHEANLETVRLAAKHLGPKVVAIDLAGAEALFPTADYEEEYRLARQLGVPFTIHAGEADGPDSVWKALEMGATRIGHGVRSAEDPRLVQYLAEHHITLEICPTSNCQTCIYPSVDAMPIRTFLEAGVPITINTDDPSIEGTDLRSEWKKVIDSFRLTKQDVAQILGNSVRASFSTQEHKRWLEAQIDNYAEIFTNIK